ncbi:hypothetical protein Pst134EA_005136 [Puccinia striiformis f. sp. tritici]|uniref:hypothetical protein n=1 Tax=Puccinia striiformis f. sp. tritici TaxID=168172 RepID=UPI002008AF2E|nr:hypothetical protein Pst134EA_005136 [Puccinia striiformis f. sp. tritici]KAH9471230.1 hypothetical protein Pst134EA_005136 [Puccinia striiformis f. sp. tritici]
MTSNPDPDEVPLGDTSTAMTTDSEGSPDEVPVSDTSSTMVADDADTDADDDPERMAEMESLAAAIVAIASTPEEVDSQYSKFYSVPRAILTRVTQE